MNIIEVKNNLVKLCYEEELKLSELIIIKESNRAYIAQILHLEASRVGKTAIAKIIFNYNNGICAYDGSIPSLRATLTELPPEAFLNHLEHSNPIVLGKVAGYKDNINVDFGILKDNPIILSEKFYITKPLLSNLALQLQARNEKVVIFDTAGMFKNNKITITKDFKLPLNASTINYIYEKGFVDATAESKAMIQSIFEELGEYSKTVEFIPFDTFKAVVDSEFMRTKLIQLIVMKNKINQIREWGVFAQNASEFEIIREKLEKDDLVIFDISKVKPSLQKECIEYVYSVLRQINSEFYAFTQISGDNSNLTSINNIIETANVHTTLICDYDYANLNELKKSSKNMLMFTPLKQQKDFGGYNIFLQKLAEDEFIAYGKMTKFVPIISKLFQLSPSDVFIPQVKETIKEQAQPKAETPAVQETPAAVQPAETPAAPAEAEAQAEEPSAEKPAEVVTEEAAAAEPQEETAEVQTDVPEATGTTEEQTETTEEASETASPETETDQEDTVDIKVEEAPQVEEITTPEVDTIKTPEMMVAEMASGSAEAVVEQPKTEEAPAAEEEPSTEEAPANEVQEALNEVEDIEDEEELSDDDLDMIEELSKPDDEIEAINPPPVEELQPEPTEQPTPEAEPVVAPVEEPAEEVAQEAEQAAPEPAAEEIPQPQEVVAEEPAAPEEEAPAVPPQQAEPLQTRANTTPVVPEYSAEFPDEDKVNSDVLAQGDKVYCEEFGEGVVEKLINYGDKELCSVNFSSVGRRLLNPQITEIKKI